MKIAIPNNGNMVNQHFGMSKSFVISTIEEGKVLQVEEFQQKNSCTSIRDWQICLLNMELTLL